MSDTGVSAAGVSAAGHEAPLKLGIVTPVLSMNPRVGQPWELTATPDDIRVIAQEADRLGFHHLTCSEHVAVPSQAVSATGQARGTRYYDPAVTLSWMAAATSRIALATHVLVGAYHHPLQVAKTYGTLDVLSGGRVILGVGVGSLHEEFELLDVPFADRGARTDDFLSGLRAAWGMAEPEYDGAFFCFSGLVVDPCALTTDPTIWIGGRTARSLRRACELGSGWVPFGLNDQQLSGLLTELRNSQFWEERDRPFDVVLGAEELDPVNDPHRSLDRLRSLQELGATHVNLRMLQNSLPQFVEQLEAVASLGILPSIDPTES